MKNNLIKSKPLPILEVVNKLVLLLLILATIGIFAGILLTAINDGISGLISYESFVYDPEILTGMLAFTLDVLILSLSIFVALNLKRLFTSLKSEEIFQMKNVTLLKRIAYATLSIAVVSLSLDTVIVTLVLLVFSSVFEAGMIIKQENEMTV